MVHVLLKTSLENFKYYFARVWDEHNCVVAWTNFDIAFLWDWSENWPFPVLWPLLSLFQVCWYIECSTFTASSFTKGRQWHPLQYSCLENPLDGGAWWAAIHGVAESQTRLSDFSFMSWRRKWQPTPMFLPGKSQGRGSLVGCCLWGCIESDTTEGT